MGLKEAVQAIGKNARLLTKDGWVAEVKITDVTVAYGNVRIGVQQDLGLWSNQSGFQQEKFVDASRVQVVE